MSADTGNPVATPDSGNRVKNPYQSRRTQRISGQCYPVKFLCATRVARHETKCKARASSVSTCLANTFQFEGLRKDANPALRQCKAHQGSPGIARTGGEQEATEKAERWTPDYGGGMIRVPFRVPTARSAAGRIAQQFATKQGRDTRKAQLSDPGLISEGRACSPQAARSAASRRLARISSWIDADCHHQIIRP